MEQFNNMNTITSTSSFKQSQTSLKSMQTNSRLSQIKDGCFLNENVTKKQQTHNSIVLPRLPERLILERMKNAYLSKTTKVNCIRPYSGSPLDVLGGNLLKGSQLVLLYNSGISDSLRHIKAGIFEKNL
jgi:hypothetical protein